MGRPGRRRARLRPSLRLRRALLARRHRPEHDLAHATTRGGLRPFSRGLHPRSGRDRKSARHRRPRRARQSKLALRPDAGQGMPVRPRTAERHTARGQTPAPTAERAPARAAARATPGAPHHMAPPGARDTRRRCAPARHLALTLVQIGESTDAVQAQLGRWRFAPDVCHAAALWAAREHANRTFTPDAA